MIGALIPATSRARGLLALLVLFASLQLAQFAHHASHDHAADGGCLLYGVEADAGTASGRSSSGRTCRLGEHGPRARILATGAPVDPADREFADRVSLGHAQADLLPLAVPPLTDGAQRAADDRESDGRDGDGGDGDGGDGEGGDGSDGGCPFGQPSLLDRPAPRTVLALAQEAAAVALRLQACAAPRQLTALTAAPKTSPPLRGRC